jgi:dCMP deaminase
MTTRPNWAEYFLDIAKAVSARADCTRRQVGCVIVDEDHRILATGYNGSYPGGPSCLMGACPRGRKTYQEQPGLVGSYDDCVATHAEANALLFARASCKGATVYLTDPPCKGCQKLLRSAGVNMVIWRDENGEVRWLEGDRLAYG